MVVLSVYQEYIREYQKVLQLNIPHTILDLAYKRGVYTCMSLLNITKALKCKNFPIENFDIKIWKKST